jgi:tetratricopeptide (TPR) repeat protein
MSRTYLKKSLAGARDEAWFHAALSEGLCLLLEDRAAAAAIEQLKAVAEDGPSSLRRQARLLIGHAYRALGKRRTAIFTYQRVARLTPADDAAVIALAALVEIGDETVAKVARQALDELRDSGQSLAALDLLSGGETLAEIEAMLTVK